MILAMRCLIFVVSYKASRIAYFLYTGIDLGDKHACHSCDQPECVNPSHIWAGTNADNCRDMALKGRATRGERNPQRKLTDTQVIEICNSPLRGIELTRLYGVSAATISMIRNNKTWKHVQR